MKKWMIPLVASLLAAPLAIAQVTGGGDDLHARFARLLHGGSGGERSWSLFAGLHGQADSKAIENHLDGLAALLDLSEPQRKQVAQALTVALPTLQARSLELAEAHAKLFEQVRAATLDEAALRQASAAMGSVEEELIVSVAHLLHDVRSVLTPEQLERVEHLGHGQLLAGFGQHVREFARAAQAWADRQ